MAAGGMDPHAFTASCSFALLSLARASGMRGASGRAVGCSWGAPGAEVRVSRLGGCGAWGAAWVLVPSPHHVLLLWCLLPGAQEGQVLRIGLQVALWECHGAEVRVLR